MCKFSQLNIEGKYTMVQTAYKGILKTDVGTMEIRALDDGRYELITCELNYDCGNPEIFTLEGDVLKFENDVISGFLRKMEIYCSIRFPRWFTQLICA